MTHSSPTRRCSDLRVQPGGRLGGRGVLADPVSQPLDDLMGDNLWIDLPGGGLGAGGLAFQVHKCAPFAFESGRAAGTPPRSPPTDNFAAPQLIGPAFAHRVTNTLSHLRPTVMDEGGKKLSK